MSDELDLDELKRVADAAQSPWDRLQARTPEFDKTFDPPTVNQLIAQLRNADIQLYERAQQRKQHRGERSQLNARVTELEIELGRAGCISLEWAESLAVKATESIRADLKAKTAQCEGLAESMREMSALQEDCPTGECGEREREEEEMWCGYCKVQAMLERAIGAEQSE